MSKVGFLLKGIYLFLLCLFCSGYLPAQDLDYFIEKNPANSTYGKVSISGFTDSQIQGLKVKKFTFKEWSTFFKVTVDNFDRPVLGKYRIKNSAIIFTPKFLPDPGVKYTLTFDAVKIKEHLPKYTGSDIRATFRFDRPGSGVAVGVHVLPEIDTLPSNVLRLYLHFSESMGFANPYAFISIEDDTGKNLNESFVEIPSGLWNPARTRLTVLLHPGRIKRGVGPHLAHGSIFDEGNSYKLIVSEGWKTASGKQISQKIEKTFIASAPVREKIDFDKWNISAPVKGTTSLLTITVNEILDKALSERMISIHDQHGAEVSGTFTYRPNSRRLLFQPTGAWQEQNYSIKIGSSLEDICGNTIHHAFDVEGDGMSQNVGKNVSGSGDAAVIYFSLISCDQQDSGTYLRSSMSVTIKTALPKLYFRNRSKRSAQQLPVCQCQAAYASQCRGAGRTARSGREMNLIKAGKKKAQPLSQFLNEL